MIRAKRPLAWVFSCLAIMMLAVSTNVWDAEVTPEEDGSLVSQGSLSPLDYGEMLEELVASTVACETSKWLLADMRNPALYTKVQRVCVAVDPAAGGTRAHYFSDPACTREIAFMSTSYSSYCREMVTVGPNTRLGNAASWKADERQINNPAPGVPSRKWTLSRGARLALSSEPLKGKTVPFMKRLRYRNVVTSYNVRPLYWSCPAGGACAPTFNPRSRGSSLLGYIKKSAEPGAVPLYWACVSAPASHGGGCKRRALVTKRTRHGGSLLGYISREPQARTLPLYWSCRSPRFGECVTDIKQWGPASRRISRESGELLGHVYAKSILKGTCSLEMRVYKKDVNARGLTPLLAFHGGGWRYRGAAFIGFEAQIAHYTEEDFVVFVPFYRLAGNVDGNSDCNEAPWSAITADAEAALDWVRQHAVAFGARPEPPALMGQSAGAHLAGWLLAHRPAEVAAGLLLYAPTDVRDFLAQTIPADGLYHRFGASLRILSGFFGSNLRAIDLAADMRFQRFVRLNSYHDYVRAGETPPVFLIHGNADTVVPSNQSVLMCNAYGGDAQDYGGGERRRAIYACGGNSHLHLFQQGEHGLDGCLRRGLIDACAAGDEISRKLIVHSLREARDWLQVK